MDEVREQGSTGGFWALFGKVGAVLTAAGTVVGIYLALNPSAPDLEAKGDYDSYALPPDLIDTIKAVQEAQSWDSLGSTISEFWKDGNEADVVRDMKIARHLKDSLIEIWPERFRYGSNPYRGFWHFVVENSGSRIAEDVVLDVPSSGVALITGRDERQEIRRITKAVNLGSVRPGDSVTVALWSEEPAGTFAFSDVRLTHADGVGNVSFPSHFYGLRALVAENLFFIGFIVVIACLWVIVIVSSFALSRGRGTVVAEEVEEPQEPG